VLVLLVPLVVLPIAVAQNAEPPATDLPVGWLLWQLFVGVGLPFFVVSSSAPLLQKWFAQTGHRQAADPYFLYAASNAGSLLALLSYPLLVEPKLGLTAQSTTWMWCYVVLVILVAACGFAVFRKSAPIAQTPDCAAPDDVSLRPSWGERGRWILLSAIPSSLMLGVTTYMTTDLAAVPLMWVVPLAIYLLTFVFVFARKSPVPHALVVKVLPFAVLPMGILLFFRPAQMEWLTIPAHLLTFFLATMLCHGELVRRRPSAAYLTEFYLLMSVGGVLGGLFNAVVAPQVFTSIAEYPIVMALAVFMLPRQAGTTDTPRDRRLDVLVPVVLGVVVGIVVLFMQSTRIGKTAWVLPAFFIAVLFTCFTFKARPVRFACSYVVLLLCVSTLAGLRTGNQLHAERNFFGVKRVLIDPTGRLRMLVHGTTTHGCQMLEPGREHEPSSYYHGGSPLGEIFATYNTTSAGPNVGIIGLGVGAVATYAKPGQCFTFYEIDPAVERIARDPRYFSFLAGSPGKCDVVLGDGRLTIGREPNGHFSLFLLDAFSSDSVPTHLLAREAIELYLSKLADDGVLAFHVSNRFFNFEPLLGRAADDLGLACVAKFNPKITPQERIDGKLGSHCVVMARRPETLARLTSIPGWHVPNGDPDTRAWTDQYCDVVGLLLNGRHLNLGPQAAVAKPQ
jgi:hypothetical protein